MKIEKKSSIVDSLLMGLLGGFVLVILAAPIIRRIGGNSGDLGGKIATVIVIGTTVSAIFRALLIWHRLRRRTAVLRTYMQPETTADPWPERPFALMSLRNLRGVRDPDVDNIITTRDWVYGDFSYNIYRRTRYGNYRAVTVYYAVMTVQLPRALPHVFFDARRARRRQFRFHFTKSQRHSLEGDFDKHFATYFPGGYIIDSLSFISPEVMWALRDASDYDIEIIGDRLFLYGSLREPSAQLADMSAKILHIKQKLLGNILTYRDERLAFAEGRRRVSSLGMELKRSNFWRYVTIGMFVIYILFRIALLFLQD